MHNKPYFKGNIYFILALRFILLLAIYTLCRAFFYLFNLSLFPGIPSDKLLLMFAGGVKFDVSAILYTNCIFIVTQILPFKFRHSPVYQKISAWIFYIINGIALAFNVGDIAYYPFTLKRTTYTVFSQFKNEDNKLSLFFNFIAGYWQVTLLYLLILFIMVFLYKKTGKTKPVIKNDWLYYSSSILMIPLVAGLVIAGMRGGFRHSTRPITLSNAGEFADRPSEMNIVLNTPFAILRTTKTKVLQKQNFYNLPELNKIYNPVHEGDSTDTVFRKKNIVILILESFSREYVGGFNKTLDEGRYKGYTPFLDSLMNHSLVFTNAYANGRKSIEGLPSVIASIPGIQEPYVLSNYSGNKINSFGSLLSAKGYHTSFFHGAPNGSMGFSSFVKMAGIKNYFGKNEYNNDNDFDGIWGIWDEPFMQFWAKNLNNFKQPFFSTLFSVSSHHPFKVPEKYEGRFPEGTLPVHQVIGYTDYSLKHFFKTASAMPWFKNTLFIITADHSSVAWHKEYKTTLGAFAIPIIIYDPSGELKGTDNLPVQQADILPSVLSYLHYKKPYFAFGNNVFNNQQEHGVVHLIDDRYQLIMDNYVLKFDGKVSKELYNYKADPFLEKNILNSAGREVKDKMEKHIKAFLQQYNAHMIDNTLTVNDNNRHR